MKTREELNALKEEVENLNKKLAELTEDELKQVAGGTPPNLPATTLPEHCYSDMFNGGPHLKPDSGLPASPIKPDDLFT